MEKITYTKYISYGIEFYNEDVAKEYEKKIDNIFDKCIDFKSFKIDKKNIYLNNKSYIFLYYPIVLNDKLNLGLSLEIDECFNINICKYNEPKCDPKKDWVVKAFFFGNYSITDEEVVELCDLFNLDLISHKNELENFITKISSEIEHCDRKDVYYSLYLKFKDFLNNLV